MQIGRAGEVICRLRKHVAKCTATRHPVDLNEFVTGVVELALVGTRHQDVRANFRLDLPAGIASIDRFQIGQVLVNLLRNAVEAMQRASGAN